MFTLVYLCLPLLTRVYICNSPRKKVPLGARLNYSIWCRKVNLEVLCRKPVFAQSNCSIYKLPFDTKLVAPLLVVPEIEAPRLSGNFSLWSL